MFKCDVLYRIQDYKRYGMESEFLSPVLHSSHSFSLEARAAAKVLYCGPGMWKVPPRACLYPGLAHYSPQAKSGLLPIFQRTLLEHGRGHPLMYCLWLLLCHKKSIATETICPTNPRLWVFRPFTEKVHHLSQIACI